jgi:hypothetical protein
MKTKLALIGAALVAFAAPAFAQENSIARLEDCVVREATRLAASREAADIVADAAVAKCGIELTAATPESGMLRSNANARAMLKDTMREVALLHVVEMRTPAPKPAPKPKAKRN